MKLPRSSLFSMVLILLVTTWLGVRRLNADGMWFDEWWSQYVAGADFFQVSRSVDAIWNRIVTENIREGALYPILLAGWGSLVGWTEFATRALSLFAGLISLAGIFRLGLALSRHPLVGVSAAALLGTSLWFVNFTHEMRNYIFMVMFTVLLLLLYQRIMSGRLEPKLRHYAALAVVTGLLFNTHFFACLAVGVVGLWHLFQLFRARPNRRWWGVMAAWVISAVIALPWLVNLPTAAALAANEPRVQPNISILFEVFRDNLYTFSNGSIALFALLAAFSLLARRSHWVWALVLVLIPVNLAAFYVFSLNEPRYNLALLPFFALIAGFGVSELAKRRVPAALLVALWLAAFFAVEGNFAVERMLQRWPGAPIREMAAVLRPHVSPDDVIINLLGAEDRPTLVHTPLVHYMGDFNTRIEVVENSTFPGTQVFAQRVRQAVGSADRVWLISDPRWKIEEWNLFEYLLNQHNRYHCATLAETSTMKVWGFGRIADDAISWQYGDGIEISIMDEPRLSNGMLQIWQAYRIAEQVPSNTYSIAIHIIDRSGQLRAQSDSGLPSAGLSCAYHELPVGDLPAGDYQLQMIVYDWRTGERLIGNTPDGETSENPILFPFPLTLPPL